MNPVDILTIATSVYTILNIVARITPTKKDDQIVGMLGKALNYIFLKSKIK